jgi:hypothetical protein
MYKVLGYVLLAFVLGIVIAFSFFDVTPWAPLVGDSGTVTPYALLRALGILAVLAVTTILGYVLATED